MPRQPRRMSRSGYVHLISRGVSRQAIFLDREDYRFYLSLLQRYSRGENVTICAYCLMENHVHLLAYDTQFNTPSMMKRIGICYSAYFNRKYDRCGHLFQDRYLSEVIEDEGALLSTFRYILNNPAKAGICPAKDYEWSSYSQFGQWGDKTSFVDCSIIRDLMDSTVDFDTFMSAGTDYECLEYNRKIDDSTANEIICSMFNVRSGLDIQKWERKARDNALRQMKEKGMTIRQIERLTGIGRGTIQRASA